MVTKDDKNAGIKGLVSAGANLVGGGVISTLGSVISGIGGALGIGENNTDPAARVLADSFAPGSLTKLGAAPESLRLAGATENAPADGTFYLHVANGDIYQSKAAGLFLVTEPWAQERKTIWQAAKLANVIPAQNPAARQKRDAWVLSRGSGGSVSAQAGFGGASGILALGLVLAAISMRK